MALGLMRSYAERGDWVQCMAAAEKQGGQVRSACCAVLDSAVNRGACANGPLCDPRQVLAKYAALFAASLLQNGACGGTVLISYTVMCVLPPLPPLLL